MKTYNIKPNEWNQPKHVIITNFAIYKEYSNLVVVYKDKFKKEIKYLN